MSISSPVTPSAFMSAHAFALVLSDVANPGMVKPRMFLRGRPSASNVRGGDDQRVRGVEAARNADHDALAVGDLEPLAQALHLDVERLVAVEVELRADRRARTGSGRSWRTSPTSRGCAPCSKRDAAERRLRMARRGGGAVERRRAHALEPQALHVDVGHRHLAASPESARCARARRPSSWIVAWPSHARSVVLSPGPAAE